MSVDPALLLNRLQNVKRTGDQQWRASCPVHKSRSRSSLAIRQVEDGRLLMHCFGGCESLEILKVCGLKMTDLMPERITHHATPAEKKKWREAATMRDWKEARKTIQHEARVVWVAGKQIQDGKPLNDADDNRLDQALERIVQAGRALNGNG